MFELVDKAGQVALMRSGEPFRYSSKALAWMGKRALEAKKDSTGLRIRAVSN